MIGGGSTADVYRALDTFTNCIAAAKKIYVGDDADKYKSIQS
jgi:hypothetical protein